MAQSDEEKRNAMAFDGVGGWFGEASGGDEPIATTGVWEFTENPDGADVATVEEEE